MSEKIREVVVGKLDKNIDLKELEFHPPGPRGSSKGPWEMLAVGKRKARTVQV